MQMTTTTVLHCAEARTNRVHDYVNELQYGYTLLLRKYIHILCYILCLALLAIEIQLVSLAKSIRAICIVLCNNSCPKKDLIDRCIQIGVLFIVF